MHAVLTVRGAREHNLRGVDLELPLGQWIAVVGPSGSGKTSLVFDTLVREGQRRFLGALSARARHFYGKLGRADADLISGLPATLAVAQNTGSETVRSTVGTLSGALDMLRLAFARRAVDPGGVSLTRSHFSFNHPDGCCESCAGLGVQDRVDPQLLVADGSRTIRGGALRPTLKSGYTVYSQVTVEVLDRICRAHGFDVDSPWNALTAEQQRVIFFGSKALRVPFGKHSIESRLRWEGITARPREEGYYLGIVPVIEETLKRNRNPNILRFVRSEPCAVCDGSRLCRPGREARLGERTLPELLARPCRELRALLPQLPDSAVLDALLPGLDERLERMERLGLGHLSLARSSPSLSGGEVQRLRLAAQLGTGLGRQLIALDEPTLGLHPGGQQGLAAVLDELRALGNTLLVVEHDPDMVRHADHLVSLGPGAGSRGGEVLESRPMRCGAGGLATAITDAPLGHAPPRKSVLRPGRSTLALRGATLHNLRDAELVLGLGTFHVIVGPSGAGKSSLVFGTLLPALQGLPGGPFRSLEGASAGAVQALDARPIGRTPRSTPATWTGLFDLVRKRFAAQARARELGLGASHFSYNTRAGRCPACQGLGFQRIGLHLLQDLELPCPHCAGGRFAAETLAVRLHGRTIAETLALTVREACEVFADDPPLSSICRAMDTLGLGYLSLGQSSHTLSRGEGQRVKLAALLGKASAEPAIVLLDEPDRGLHPADVSQLLGALDALVDAGHTVLAISHHRHLWAAADALTEVVDGRTRVLTEVDLAPLAASRVPRPPAALPDAIRLCGVTTNNLADIDVQIPHGKLTVIAGVSGSGKTSLAYGTLAAEAWRRSSESLPFQVRRFLRRLPRAELESAEGLGPTLSLRPGQARAAGRSTVATQSEIGPLLRLLWSRAGTLDGKACTLTAAHFSTDQSLGACLACAGRGLTARCDPARLLTDPGLSLAGGALAGTRPGRFFSEPHGQHLATLQAAAGPDADLGRPWEQLSEELRQLALHGAGDKVFSVRWQFVRGKRSGEHSFEGPWDGFLRLVEREARRRVGARNAAEWQGPLIDVPCNACAGSGLKENVRRVVLGGPASGLTLPELLRLPLSEVAATLARARDELGSRREDSGLLLARCAVLNTLLPELTTRLDDLVALGLGHLALGRSSASLSAGELHRTRIASVLRAGLSGVTFVLDEPDAGLHTRDVAALMERLHGLVRQGNTVVLVSHRPEVLRAADQLIELGPGPGVEGGRIIACGPPAQVLSGNGPTASALRANSTLARACSDAPGRLRIVGARAHNLADIDVELPLSGFVCVSGVSGSGKSSLIFDVLEASARAAAPRECEQLLFVGKPPGEDSWPLDAFHEVQSSRRPSAARTVISAMALLPSMQSLFHGQCRGTELKLSAFSFLSAAGRCELCKGSGREIVPMDFQADLALPCPRCHGRRYRDQVLAVRWQGMTVVEFLERPLGELLALTPEGRLHAGLSALIAVGLSYLSLGRRANELSAGEWQRVSLAAGLAGSTSPTLYLLDEPARGLHESDLLRLLVVFRRLAARGDLIVAAEHRTSLIAAADCCIELGPGSGAAGGRLVVA